MSTVTNRTRTRKPFSRSVAVLEQPTPDTDGWGAIQLTVNGKAAVYLCKFIPCELGAGILGLEVEKLADDMTTVAERYHTAVDPFQGFHSCECLGFLKHNHCKHVDGLAKLVELGRLTPPAFPSRLDEVA